MSDNLSLGVGVSLALSNSRSRSISVLAAISSIWEFELVTILLSEVFKGPTVALLFGIVVRLLG